MRSWTTGRKPSSVSTSVCLNARILRHQTLDDHEPDVALGIINNYVQSVEERANDWVSDVTQWAEIATARIEARAKAKAKRKAKGKQKEPA